jgi:Tfp pilus assembly protein FimT
MRRGATLLELASVLALVGVLALMALPRLSGWNDRLVTRRAALDLAAFYNRARFAAIFRGSVVRVEFGADSLRAVLEDGADSTILIWPGPARRRGTHFHASRPVVWIDANGLGWGAANTKLVVWRGAAADSLTTSRLGRLRRWW